MRLRNGLTGDQLRSLAARFDYPGGDKLPQLIGELSRRVGHYDAEHFLDICEWKTPRSRQQCRRNSEDDIKRQTRIALRDSTLERDRIQALRELYGVDWPTASVLLHFAHKQPYPILDYRTLWSLGFDESPNYSFRLWWDYVEACRLLSREFSLSMREFDRALWQFSKENQPTKSGARNSLSPHPLVCDSETL